MPDRRREPSSTPSARLGAALRAALSEIEAGRLRTSQDVIQTAASASGALAGDAELARLARLLAHRDLQRAGQAACVVMWLVLDSPNEELCSQVAAAPGLMPALVARLADPRRPPSFHAALSLLAGEPAAADAVLGARFDALAAVAQQAAVPSHPDAYHGLLILTGVFATAHDRGGDEAREVAERLARERSLLASLAERAGAGPEAAGEATWEAIVQGPAIKLLIWIGRELHDTPAFRGFSSTPGLVPAAARAVATARNNNGEPYDGSPQLALLLMSQRSLPRLTQSMAEALVEAGAAAALPRVLKRGCASASMSAVAALVWRLLANKTTRAAALQQPGLAALLVSVLRARATVAADDTAAGDGSEDFDDVAENTVGALFQLVNAGTDAAAQAAVSLIAACAPAAATAARVMREGTRYAEAGSAVEDGSAGTGFIATCVAIAAPADLEAFCRAPGFVDAIVAQLLRTLCCKPGRTTCALISTLCRMSDPAEAGAAGAASARRAVLASGRCGEAAAALRGALPLLAEAWGPLMPITNPDGDGTCITLEEHIAAAEALAQRLEEWHAGEQQERQQEQHQHHHHHQQQQQQQRRQQQEEGQQQQQRQQQQQEQEQQQQQPSPTPPNEEGSERRSQDADETEAAAVPGAAAPSSGATSSSEKSTPAASPAIGSQPGCRQQRQQGAAPPPRTTCAECGVAEGGSRSGDGGGGARLRLCRGCRAVRYCSPACAAVAWKAGHKQVCLAAQQAAKSAAQGAEEPSGGAS